MGLHLAIQLMQGSESSDTSSTKHQHGGERCMRSLAAQHLAITSTNKTFEVGYIYLHMFNCGLQRGLVCTIPDTFMFQVSRSIKMISQELSRLSMVHYSHWDVSMDMSLMVLED